MAVPRAVLVFVLLLGTIIAGAQAYDSVVEFASEQDDLSVVLQLVKDAGLAGTLDADFAGSVFLPTNDAFKKIEALTKTLTPKQVKKVLLYHLSSTFVRNRWFDDRVPARRVSTLLLRATVTLTGNGDELYLNKSEVKSSRKVGKAKVFIISDVLIPAKL